MKKPVKPVLALALAVLMAAAMLGCQLVSVNEEKDMAQIVAKVGEYEITKEEYLNQLEYSLYMYQSIGMDPTTNEEDFEAFKQSVLDEVIGYEMQYYQALQYKLDTQLSEETRAEIQAQVDEYDTMVYEEAKAAADTRVAENASLVFDDVMKEEYRTVAASFFGEEMSQPEVRQYVEDFFMKQNLSTMITDHIYDGITVTDDEVRAAYDEQLAADKESLANTPSNYKNLQEGYERAGGIPPLFAPADYKRYRDIVIEAEGELSAEYDQQLLEMADLEGEIGALVLQEETEEIKTRIAEIRAAHAALKTETDAEFEAFTSKVRARAEEAYQKLQDGAAFDTVMKEYTADTDFQDGGAFIEKGKLVYKDEAVADMDAVLKTAFLALTQKGSYTELLELEDTTYHIVQYVGDEPTGERPFADHEEALRTRTLSNKQSAEWNALLKEWISDETLVTRYPDVLDSI